MLLEGRCRSGPTVHLGLLGHRLICRPVHVSVIDVEGNSARAWKVYMVCNSIREIDLGLLPCPVLFLQGSMEDKVISIIDVIDIFCRLRKIHSAPFEDAVLVANESVKVERGGTVGPGFVATVSAELSADEFEGGGRTVERHHSKGIQSKYSQINLG